MKKLILVLVLLALVVSPAAIHAKKDQAPLGSRGNGVLCTDDFSARPARSDAALEKLAEELSYPPYPYEDTFKLHSCPSSDQKLYIDLDGHKGGYKAYDTDGDPSTFSNAERLEIQKIWYCTSEDFMPFNIDVTTEEPPSGWDGTRCVVDGGKKYDYGWAYKGVWPDSSQISYSGFWDGSWQWIGTAISHEVGHTLDLFDHGDDQSGYYMGHGTGWTMWGCIMGWDSDSLGIWDDGDYPYANHPEDSLAIIVGSANPGVHYRTDDHGNSISTATAVDITDDIVGISEYITAADEADIHLFI